MCICVGYVHGTAGALRGLKGVSFLLEVGKENQILWKSNCVLLPAEPPLQPQLANI